ncbi:efflux RND transporter permease subunit [Solimonas variicoloris]|uniref:efflux RND transporter permease subunit n=1 Tax=Solimonas variicoloris TaxID=254408 RepID=UPI00036D561E|nr:efflux RND transporter permease subunit [Solimonas variicoloris]
MTPGEDRRLGISGSVSRRFLTTEITPLLALAGLLLGLFAVIVTPREEEPQINVTFANVFIAFPGASAKEVESLVTGPAEQIVAEIEGVEHIYSASQPGMALLTVRYRVGEPRTDAIVRLYNAFYQHADRLPQGAGVMPPLIQPKGIDDVPIFAATLWSDDPAVDNDALLRVARSLENELQREPGARNVTTIGGPDRVVRIALDPQRLAAYDLAIDDLQKALAVANSSLEAGSLVRDNRETLLQAGTFLATPEDVASVVVGVKNGAPVFLRDVAEVHAGADWPARYAKFGGGPARDAATTAARVPALTLTVSKKPGENAVDVAAALEARLAALRGIVIPDAVHVSVTRNYGVTAQDKAQTLIKKLIFATASVIVLVLFALGRREAIVVGAAVIATLAITLFASWAWGFTLNRVSLFALIFSIGILVDDAIVVVENIHRHMTLGHKSLTDAIPAAVDEVGGPTILATFTVIAALLPMAFVSGLMGPYMRPIPINASTGMLISLAVAFVFTPWLYRRLFLKTAHAHAPGEDRTAQRLRAFFTRVMTPFLRGRDGRGQRVRLLLVLLLLITASVSLVGFKAVILKMLPFDNKSEFQVLVDMPEGTPLEQTTRVLDALADYVQTIPEVTDYQIYAGAAAPINFNGLVRQYYLRSASYQGDIQVNLLDKHLRHRKSHEIALAARAPLAAIGKEFGATVSIVEVPPGPPVQAPLVAEIYGLDYARQQDVARQVRAVFAATPDVVDIDDSIVAPQAKLVAQVDRVRAAQLGIGQQQVTAAIAAAVGGRDLSWLHDEQARVAVPLRLQLPPAERADPDVLGALRLRAASGALVPLSEFVQLRPSTREPTILRKDLMPVVYVTGDVAGHTDSPLYGLRTIAAELGKMPIDGAPIEQLLTQQPDNPAHWSLKWDGEWQVTYETFRDMGIAYSVGLVLIYLLVVAQFRSYTLPLIIMAPIPMTIAGIMPGHALLGQQFTAPSMIGMIALAGIIVRNSILLVDFIEQEVREGKPLQQATIEAAAIRARPIALTAVAAMAGGFFIIDDPIFGGLAVSLIFGLLVSTVLTLLVIPVVYYAYHYRKAEVAPAQP